MNARTQSAGGTALLVTSCAMVMIIAATFVVSQDWIPFYVAAKMAPAGEWASLYPAPDTSSLFDVSPAYRDAANVITQDGATSFKAHSLTAFVSPPPAAFLLTLANGLEWRTNMIVWRLMLAVPLIMAFLGLAVHQSRLGPAAIWRWSVLCAISTPVVLFAVAAGQPSAWLIVVAVISVLPPTRSLDGTGAVVLTLAVLTKATPILLVAGFFLVGRRRLAWWSIALIALAVAAASPVAGVDAWRHFLGLASHVGNSVITDRGNVSVDASLLRLATGITNTTLQSATTVTFALSWIVRAGLMGIAGWCALRPAASPARRASAVWVAWMASTPLLWFHYLGLVVPLLASTALHKASRAIVLTTILSAAVTIRLAGWTSGWAGTVTCVTWLLVAAWLLSRDAWDPPRLTSPARDSRSVR